MIQMMPTKKFSDIWDKAADFVSEYGTNGIPTTITTTSATTLYYLLYAKYGNSSIANFDETQFKYKVFSLIFMYGPSWEKRINIQSALRDLSADDIQTGFKTINNKAFGPGTDPSTGDTGEVDYVNEQLVQKSKKGIVESYAALWSMIKTDVTAEFLGHFRPLFMTVVRPIYTPTYVEEIQEGEE